MAQTYPFAVPVDMTSDWYLSQWREYSGWCNNTFGIAEWEFTRYSSGPVFLFKHAEQKMMFELRWK